MISEIAKMMEEKTGYKMTQEDAWNLVEVIKATLEEIDKKIGEE